MTRPAVAARVKDQLELLAQPGGAHYVDGPNSTMSMFSEVQRVQRGVSVIREYLNLQEGVTLDGRAAVATAGPPGAGKTSAAVQASFALAGYRDIDADVIKEMLIRRALSEGSFDHLLTRTLADDRPVRPMELASLVHRESTAIADNVQEICLLRGENVLIQGTLAWDEQPRIILERLDASEYNDLVILDVEVDLGTAIERTTERWWVGRNDPSDPFGGRFVSATVLSELYLPDGTTKCSANAEVLLALSDRMGTELRRSYSVGDVRHETITRKGASGSGRAGAGLPN